MKDVFIKAKIKNKDEELPFEGKGTFDEKKNLIQYQDNKAVLTIFLDDNIMLRETEDTILSYKFVENEKTNFEVFLKDLKQTGKVIKKQVKDYQIIVNYTEHEYIEYKCECCGKIFHEPIPNHLKEECQYGSNVKSIALTLGNVGNVPFNKTRRILSGLSMGEIGPCEGYLAKLQKTASKGLESFIQ